MNDCTSTSGNVRTVSFRDPAGQVLAVDDRILRIVNRSGLPNLNSCLASKTVQRFMDRGRLAATRVLDASETMKLLENVRLKNLFENAAGRIIIEHEQVPFRSYPYEWPPEMLHEAARLTLDLATGLLEEGLGLKDATPYNVLFQACEPVFIDLLSIERREPGDPIWLPYTQFVQAFLLPLLANKYFGIPLADLLISRRDGLKPEEVYPLCGLHRKLLPPFLTMVTIPAWLTARHKKKDLTIYQKRYSDNFDQVRFILQSQFGNLRRALERLAPQGNRKSYWSSYTLRNDSYSRDQFAAKRAFVENIIMEFCPKRVLDVGCNNGCYSAIAAGRGARVVAIDRDPDVVGAVWRHARSQGLDILPMVVDICRPSPATGWRNRECAPFLERAGGAFDAVLMLAVIHHMLISERVPLPEIIDLAADLTTDLLVIEYIAPADPMFRSLARSNEHLYQDLAPGCFEAACRRRFNIVRQLQLNNSRILYLMRNKSGGRHA